MKLCKRWVFKSNSFVISSSLGRIITVRYEDLAEYPLRAFGKLYKFLGLNFTQQVRSFINERTTNQKQSSKYICYLQQNKSLSCVVYSSMIDKRIKCIEPQKY